MEVRVGDWIRCDPRNYAGLNPKSTEWHTIVRIDEAKTTYEVVGPDEPGVTLAWDMNYSSFEYIHQPFAQKVI